MNISIVTSFTIGGLFILSILALNNSVVLHSAETTVEMTTQYKQDELFDMITHDLSRIGYGFPSGGTTVEVEQLTDHKIKFTADVMDTGVQEFTWNFTGNLASQTSNPHDKILIRTGTMGNGTPSDLQTYYYVTDFKITGYKDTFGEEVTVNPGEVKSFLVEIVYESDLPTNLRNEGQDMYSKGYWRKLIVPKNLQF